VINFRYHVVSIVAVFLALAVGIILGATELRGTALDALNRTSTDLANELNAAHAQNRLLQQEVTGDQEFGQADMARLLGGLLDNQRVVLVAAPAAPGAVINGLTAALRQAGATVTGQVNLQPKLLDDSESNQQFLSTLVQTLASSNSVTSNGTPLQQAAQLLGGAILTRNAPSSNSSGGDSGESATTRQDVLSSYGQAGLLSVSGPLSVAGQAAAPATLAIVVTPAAAPAGGNADPANQGLVTLAQELNTAGLGTVMAGSIGGSVSGSAVDALRSSSAGSLISSVDDADTVIGQIVAVQALAQELAGHKPGSYGDGPGSSGAGPSPAPTPSPTSSTQVTGATSSAKKSSKGKT
jgi:Copper transport outer membrane protein, MctB